MSSSAFSFPVAGNRPSAVYAFNAKARRDKAPDTTVTALKPLTGPCSDRTPRAAVVRICECLGDLQECRGVTHTKKNGLIFPASGAIRAEGTSVVSVQ